MIQTNGVWFKDEEGRRLLLRGVNLGGSSKVPAVPDGASHRREGFFDHRRVSFAGRPFPLEEADEHFSRLQAWGYGLVRLIVTWEAVEHAGPGQYDEAYLDYLQAIVMKAAEYGIQVLIDPHQDVWSRFSGGDGAPGWTLEAVGFDIKNFAESGAAIVHATHGDPFPRMIWPTNTYKLAAATMFTLFFGGDDFAPAAQIDGRPVQAYLQDHYLGAVKEVAGRLAALPNVIGYDTMNEPHSGFIGRQNLTEVHGRPELGYRPSPWKAMLLGDGFPQQVGDWRRGILGARQRGRPIVNSNGVRAWQEGSTCIWRQNGVWEVSEDGQPRLLRPDYFFKVEGRIVDFNRDYYRPFLARFVEEIRSVHPGAIIFAENALHHPAPHWPEAGSLGIAYAPHWYDVFVLFLKQYNRFLAADLFKGSLVAGPGRIRRSFARQLARFKDEAAGHLGGAPALIGECGIPFDLDGGRAYRSGAFKAQIQAMDRTLTALDDNLLSYTLWNYSADNNNERGDRWNGEDLSIFSRDQQRDPADVHSGGRALEAVVRPYARATAGEPLAMEFDRKRRRFTFTFRHDPAVKAPTELFIPTYQYPQGYVVEVSDGTFEQDPANQCLLYRHGEKLSSHTIQISPAARQF